jgi:hypothetical protein
MKRVLLLGVVLLLAVPSTANAQHYRRHHDAGPAIVLGIIGVIASAMAASQVPPSPPPCPYWWNGCVPPLTSRDYNPRHG